ncbi:hypothetical protein DRQ25_04645 [Candidatus Fermentibacteria bacterium]|nr:MAG: hypothetical protein DRQ25_04645 [Candidatus Fermentibacteria bacterium]
MTGKTCGDPERDSGWKKTAFDETCQAIVLAQRYLMKIRTRYGGGVNLAAYISAEREWQLKDKDKRSKIYFCLKFPIQEVIGKQRYGEEKSGRKYTITLRSFAGENQCIAISRTHTVFSVGSAEEEMEKLFFAFTHPVFWKKKNGRSGYGFRWNEEQLLIEGEDTKLFQELVEYHISHFTEIRDIEMDSGGLL